MVAGKPNSGKSLLMQFWALINGMQNKVSLSFTTETSRNYYMNRIMAMKYKIQASHFKNGMFSDDEKSRD